MTNPLSIKDVKFCMDQQVIPVRMPSKVKWNKTGFEFVK